ncbi:MAG: hypothetical protein WA188_16475 [Terriglobales bacterium]
MNDDTFFHRAFCKIWLSPTEIGLSLVVMLGGTAGWIVSMPRIASFWAKLLSFWMQRLWPGTAVLLIDRTVVGHWRVPVPYFKVDAGPIDGWTWLAVAAGSVVLFVLSYRIPSDTQLPFVYLLRTLAAIQWSALAYTRLARRPFPQDASEYCASMLLFGLIFIGLMPVILGFTFYIFDVSIWKKIALTAVTVGHLTLFIPLQYLAHACILRVSLLFLPILYFVLGPLVDVIVFIAFYSWGMSWRSSHPTGCQPYSAGAHAAPFPSRYENQTR